MRRSRGANGGGGVVAAGADRDEPALGPERVRDDEAVCACVAVHQQKPESIAVLPYYCI